VDKVKFEGANHIPDADREELIASLKTHDFYNDEGWLDDAAQLVGAFWRNRGYFKVNVTPEKKILNPGSAPEYVELTFHVEEGLQYRLKTVRFQSSDPEVPLVFPPEQLRKLVPMRDGDLVSFGAMRDGLEAFRQLYDSRGYVDFTSVPVTDIDDESNQISLIFQMDQERQFYIAKIDFLGNRPQAEDILRSQMKVGDIFSEHAVDEFYLQNKSLLPADASSRDLVVSRNQKAGSVTLTFDFRDCPTN
jgi:outer membrane protein assembly factor BamA